MKLKHILKRAALLGMAAMLSASLCLTASAEEIARSGWSADFTGDAIQSNFNPYDWYAAMCELLPGDSAVLRVDVKNSSDEYVQWYISNATLQTLEDTRAVARDGGYAYKLTYTSNGTAGNVPDNGSGVQIDGGTKSGTAVVAQSGGAANDADGAYDIVAVRSTKMIHWATCKDVVNVHASDKIGVGQADWDTLYDAGYIPANCLMTDGAVTHAGDVQAQAAASNTVVLFDSETVGGDGGSGLYEATDGLSEYAKLCTMAPGGSGYVTLYVKLDGETQGNGYQNTLAKLRLNFAVNIVPANYVEVPGDPTHVTVQDPPTRIEIPGDPTYVIPEGNPPLSDIPQFTDVPQTGDNVKLAVWSSLAMLCGAGGIAAFVIWRKKDKEADRT